MTEAAERLNKHGRADKGLAVECVALIGYINDYWLRCGSREAVREGTFDEFRFMRRSPAADLGSGADGLLGWRWLMLLVGLPGLLFYLQGRTRFMSISVTSAPSDSPL